MWTWLVSLFASKAVPAIQHSLWRTVSVVCVLAIIVAIAYAGYIAYWKPWHHPLPSNTTTVQSGGVSNTYEIKVGFGGCARIPGMEKKK